MEIFKLRDLLRHAVIYGIGGISQSALGFILLPILTARMSLSDFGAYSLVLMSATIAGAIFYLGMTSAMPRSYFDFNEEHQRKSIFTTAFIILVLGAIAQIAIGWWFSPLVTQIVLQSANPLYITAMQWAFFGGAITFVNQYFFSYLRIKRYSVSTIFFSIGGLIVGAMLTLGLLHIGGEPLIAPFKAIAITQILTAIGIIFVYGREMFTTRISFKECKPLLHFGLATILTSFGVMAFDWADRIIIERYMSLADVGLYSAASRVSGLMGVLLIAPFTQIWSPMMFEYQNNEGIKKITSKVFSYFLMAGGIFLVLISLFSAEIFHFLIKFDSTQTLILVFLLLALASLINATANIVVAGIFYERKVYLMPFIYASIACIKIALNICLIPAYGIRAAAFNALISAILIPCAIYWFSKKYFNFTIEWSRLIKLSLVVAIPMVFCVLIQPDGRSMENFAEQMLLTIIILIVIYKACFTSSERKQIEKTIKNIRIALFPRG